MHLSRYLKIYPSQNRPGHYLVYSTLRGSLAVLPAETLQAIDAGTLPEAERDALARIGMLVDAPLAEKERMLRMLERINASARVFKAIVVLNLDCNLNCCYCYEEDLRGGYYMSDATADLLVETLLRDRISQGYDVVLSFYGGEPLLSKGLIRRISLPLLAGAERHGVKYSFNLVTNGTLLNRDAVLELLPLGLSGAKFTLDGPREVHDGQRPYASGAGSFDAIVDNLAEVCGLIPIQLGGNFKQENYRDFPRLLDELTSRGIAAGMLPHVQFTPVTPKAGCSEYGSGCASTSEPWLVEALVYLREEIMSRGFRTSSPRASACMIELESNVVVSCEGDLYKCPALMGYDGMKAGSLADGIADYRQSHGIGNWQVEACLDCCYLPLCFGGCRFVTKLQGRELTEVDCRKYYFDAALERTLLQNLTYPAPLRKEPPPSPAATRVPAPAC